MGFHWVLLLESRTTLLPNLFGESERRETLRPCDFVSTIQTGLSEKTSLFYVGFTVNRPGISSIHKMGFYIK